MTRLSRGGQITERIIPSIHERPLVVDLERDRAAADHLFFFTDWVVETNDR